MIYVVVDEVISTYQDTTVDDPGVIAEKEQAMAGGTRTSPVAP